MRDLQEDVLEQRAGILRVAFPEVGGGYELTSEPLLSQAVGECYGIDFCFHAKYGEWEFETEDKEGHPFPKDHPHCFARRGRYDQSKPGVLGVEWAARLIRTCLAEFWQKPTR